MSATAEAIKATLKGGEFLRKASRPEDIFIPEDFNEEQQMIIDTTREFVDKEILPVVERLEIQEPGLTESLLEKAGELGLLGMAIPEEYGGFGKDFNTNTAVLI